MSQKTSWRYGTTTLWHGTFSFIYTYCRQSIYTQVFASKGVSLWCNCIPLVWAYAENKKILSSEIHLSYLFWCSPFWTVLCSTNLCSAVASFWKLCPDFYSQAPTMQVYVRARRYRRLLTNVRTWIFSLHAWSALSVMILQLSVLSLTTMRICNMHYHLRHKQILIALQSTIWTIKGLHWNLLRINSNEPGLRW